MTTKIVKKKKLRLNRIILFLIFLILVIFLTYYILNSKIENIIVKGNSYLDDDDIINITGIKNYPKFILTFNYQMKNSLESSPFIKSADIKKTFHNTVIITVQEYEILLKNSATDKYVTSNVEEVNYNKELRVPRLTNTISASKMKSLISSLEDVDKDILGKISEIKYVPNEYDKDRYLLYMNDDNAVYLTLTKFEMINYYNKVLPQLEGRKGILYLDSGNHFKIME